MHFAIIFTALTVSDRLAAEETLGHFPLGEASAALLVTCPGGKGECLLVGDNEQGRELYLFPVKDQKLDSDKQSVFDLHLGNGEISDVKALASVSSDEILVFASHSRDSKCEVEEKRHQFGKVSLSKAKTAVVDTLLGKKVTCEHLFGKQILDASMKAACDAIDTTDGKATRIDDDRKAKKLSKDDAKDSCNKVNAYNAEGAVAIAPPQRDDRYVDRVSRPVTAGTLLSTREKIWPSCST